MADEGLTSMPSVGKPAREPKDKPGRLSICGNGRCASSSARRWCFSICR